MYHKKKLKSMSGKAKEFKITPNDLYNWYIVGLPNLTRDAMRLIKVSLMECYRRGYSKGFQSGLKLAKDRYINNLTKI